MGDLYSPGDNKLSVIVEQKYFPVSNQIVSVPAAYGAGLIDQQKL